MKTEQTNKINKIENKFLSYKNNELVNIILIKNIRICNHKEENLFQIIFNLIDNSNTIWKFDDENTMENIFKKTQKELNIIELNKKQNSFFILKTLSSKQFNNIDISDFDINEYKYEKYNFFSNVFRFGYWIYSHILKINLTENEIINLRNITYDEKFYLIIQDDDIYYLINNKLDDSLNFDVDVDFFKDFYKFSGGIIEKPTEIKNINLINKLNEKIK